MRRAAPLLVAFLSAPIAFAQTTPILGGGTRRCPAGQAVTAVSSPATCSALPASAPPDAKYLTMEASGGLSAEVVVPTCTGTDKLTSNGTALTCAADQGLTSAAPVGAKYVTTAADATLTQEIVLPTCTGSDKLTFNGTTISCAADQGTTPDVVYAASDTTYTCNTWSSFVSSASFAANSTVGIHCAVWIVTPASIASSSLSSGVSGPANPAAVYYSQTVWDATTATSPTIRHVGMTTAYDSANVWTGSSAPTNTTFFLTADAVIKYGATAGAASFRVRQSCGTGSAVTFKAGSFCTFTPG